MVRSPSFRVAVLSDVQPLNAEDPRLVTVFGSATDLSALHLLKA